MEMQHSPAAVDETERLRSTVVWSIKFFCFAQFIHVTQELTTQIDVKHMCGVLPLLDLFTLSLLTKPKRRGRLWFVLKRGADGA